MTVLWLFIINTETANYMQITTANTRFTETNFLYTQCNYGAQYNILSLQKLLLKTIIPSLITFKSHIINPLLMIIAKRFLKKTSHAARKQF